MTILIGEPNLSIFLAGLLLGGSGLFMMGVAACVRGHGLRAWSQAQVAPPQDPT